MSERPIEFAAAFEAAFARLQVRVEEAYHSREQWPEQVAAAIRAGFEFAAENPGPADLLTNRALAQGPRGIARYQRLVGFAADLLVPGRDERPENSRLPKLTERALAGGVATLVSQRLDQGQAADLPALAPEAIRFVLSPYLGAARAGQIANGL